MSPVLLAMASAPWSVGPAPSAHDVAPGVRITASGTAYSGPFDKRSRASQLLGGSVGVEVAPVERVWMSLDAQPGAGWTTCPDCGSVGFTARGRGLLLRHPNLGVAGWGVATATVGTVDGTVGIAAEGGTRHVRFDTSWPLASSLDLLSNLRITPELGATMRWSARQRSRLAVVGLEPAVALQHRARLGEAGRWELAGTVRLGEEGLGVTAGLAFQAW